MDKIVFTVHEFMAVMGSMDENLAGKKAPEGSVYNEWHEQWKVLDERLEELDPMPRADMLFDGKVTINAITEPQLQEVVGVVENQIAMHEKLIDDDDEEEDDVEAILAALRAMESDDSDQSATSDDDDDGDIVTLVQRSPQHRER